MMPFALAKGMPKWLAQGKDSTDYGALAREYE
jgi:hypothetical protein